MSYKISGGFSDTQDNLKNFSQKGSSNDSGPYIGVIKNTVDPLKMGRLGVVIPHLSQTDGHDINPEQVIWCQYLSPFYGAKPFKVSTKDPAEGPQQRSYGMWAIPPDVDTNVLVIFAKGEKGQQNAFWLGCIQEPLTNHMIPGHAVGNAIINSNNYSEEERRRGGGSTFKDYGVSDLPVQEKNKNRYSEGETNLTMEEWERPVNTDLADQLEEQGLLTDYTRGLTTSSARRESPSRVFGWNTPGPISDDSRELNIGMAQTPLRVDRDLGHSFVMDDGDEDFENQLVRLRTASGHQLLMHDTDGVVYIAHASGKTFIEMDVEGKLSIYATDGISMRTEGDFNLHSDKNIQFHAKEKIKFTAEEDVVLNAEKYIYAMGQSGILNASHKGSVRHYAKDGITSFTDGPQLHGASGRIDLAGSQVHFNSVPARETWGPSWMKPDHDKIQIIVKEGEIDIDAYAPLDQGEPGRMENKTTVRDTSIGRGMFNNDIDPQYEQPTVVDAPDGGYNGMRFDNAWEELEAMMGVKGDGVMPDGTYNSKLGGISLGQREKLLINEFGVVTPFMDKENGVGNIAEKKEEFYKKLRERQKAGLPDAVGGVFVTHEPWSRGAKAVKRIKDPQYDPYHKGNFRNAWLEWEAFATNTANTDAELERRDELIKMLGIARYDETGNYGSNVAEAKARYYEGLKERQAEYESLSSEEQDKILDESINSQVNLKKHNGIITTDNSSQRQLADEKRRAEYLKKNEKI